jgi:RHS repeat-associated protein
VTDGSGAVVQVLDYYPYGSRRINSGSQVSDRQFIGERYDASTDLNYLNARYYEANRGQFLSEDPVFWEIGQTPDGKAALSNPQSMNSYAYAGGNPITNKDPNGRFWWVGFYDWSGYEGMKGVGMKALEVMGGHNRAMNAMQANQGTVSAMSAKYGVNPALANAVMYEEQSHLLNLPGIPFESTKDYLFPNSQLGGYDGGVGVMQVTGGVGQQYGYDKYELARDPRKNIDAGIGNLGKVQSGSTAMTASRYNNGSTQTVTNYGQRVAAQVNNPNYNTNVLVYGLQQIVAGLQSIISSLKK